MVGVLFRHPTRPFATMKRGFSNVDDDSPTANQQATKYSKNPNNGRKLTFQVNDSLRDVHSSPSAEFKIKTHQSTPYPKQRLRQLKDEDDEQDEIIVASAARSSAGKRSTETVEKRNPEYLNKICSLNRSFIRWIDTYFNKGDNFDFTPVCYDYIRFMNRLKEKYPNENGDLFAKDKQSTADNCLAESSPSKNKTINFYSTATIKFANTPPPNPGDPGYKSTPHPKNLLKQQQTIATSGELKFGTFTTSKPEGEEEKANVQQQKPVAKFEFLPQSLQTNEDKKEVKFTSFLSTGASSLPTGEFSLGRSQMVSNSISKNLFDIKPKLSNSSPLQLSPVKDAATPAPKPIDNHFATDSLFNTQLNQSVSKLADTTDPNMTANTTVNDTINDDENYKPPKPESVAHVEEDSKYSVK